MAVGVRARYVRTGTIGTVTAVQAIDGDTYAVLDSTGLLYRADQLAPAATRGERRERQLDSIEEQLRRDREGIYREDGGQFDLDNSCEGGG